jgi:hypothetical protein
MSRLGDEKDNKKEKLGFFGIKAGQQAVGCGHGLINYIDSKAECRHLKKLTC